MKIAYVILAFQYPQQLLRLLNALQSKDTAFFVHIDKKVEISPFKNILREAVTKNVTFIKRENSYWASIGLVKAAINGITEVLNAAEKYDYLYFLSGQCYPIKSKIFINQFFYDNRENTFILSFPLPYKWWGGNDGMDRINLYHFQEFKNRTIPKVINRCLKYLNPFLPKRKFPKYLKPYGGEFYFGFSLETAKYIISFIEEHPDYLSFHRFSYIPDEMFFQTILSNSTDDKIRSTLVNKMLTYVNWKVEPGQSRPKIMRTDDFNVLLNSDKLFARKFDITVDSKVLDMIDDKILG
jgi:hypothetical protein